MSNPTCDLPAIHRPRPTDATGWFWTLVLVLFGCFYVFIWPAVGGALLLAAPFSFAWQFKKWHHDAEINRQARQWCENYYPTRGDAPVPDLIIALAHVTGCSPGHLTPDTALATLTDDYFENEYADPRRGLFEYVLAEARISVDSVGQFRGTTLDDAVRYVCDSAADRDQSSVRCAGSANAQTQQP